MEPCCLSLIGVLGVLYAALYLLKPIFTFFIIKSFLSKRKDLKKAGEWAIVTGATDGIGKGFARALAKDGLNILLISRNEERLKETAKEIEDYSDVDTKIFVADFSKV